MTYGEYGPTRMIRTPRYKLVVRYPRNPSPPSEGAAKVLQPDELYDLLADSGETRNLAADAAHAAVREQLQAQLETWYAAHESPGKTGRDVTRIPLHNQSGAFA